MQIHLIFVGKTAFPDLDTGIQRYLERLRHYVSVTVHLVKAEKITRNTSEAMVREREGERIQSLIGREGYLIVWDQHGKLPDSPEFARLLERIQNVGASKVWMVIGGPVGVSKPLLDRADTVLSLSRMTFPHDMARLLVLEQLYRAFTILKGEPYHK